MKGIKLIHERNEYPFLGVGTNFANKLSLYIYLRIVLKHFDGLFVISNNLLTYFRNYYKKEIAHILMMVEPDRFSGKGNNSYIDDYIAYTGTIYGNKDGVDILIEAFAHFSEEYSQIKLMIIGDISEENKMEKIYALVDKYKIKEKVIFTGLVDRDKIPNLLSNAKALCLARPSSIQSEGGFPTKLGEYLITGLPVLVTKVGEIPNYLIDGKNAFLSEPDDSYAFSLKLKEIFKDYERAKCIGKEGKLLAKEIFSYVTQSRKLLEYLQTL